MPETLDGRPLLERAVLELMVECGYEEMTPALVAERAGLDRAAFESCFDGLEDAVLQVYWRHTDEFTEMVFAAYESEPNWRDGFRKAAYAAARYIRENPEVVRFGTVRMFAAGLMAQAQRASHLQRMVDLIDAGRQELEDPDSVGRGVAEGVFGSIYETLVKEVQANGRARSPESLVPQLMFIAVRPYCGHEAAREELSIPPPQPSTEAARRRSPSRYGPTVGDREVSGNEGAMRLARLPPGRHGLPREFVTRNQRDRLAAGMITVVAERGLNAATITQICAAAGLSRRTFYSYFPSKEACFFAAYDTILEHLRLATDAAAADEEDWGRQVAVKLRTTLEFLAANPDLARFCFVAPQRAGEQVAVRYRKVMDGAFDYLCDGMPDPPATREPSEAVAASLVGGMTALVVRKVQAEEGEYLPDLLADLTEFFLTPYLGRAAATEIARNPP